MHAHIRIQPSRAPNTTETSPINIVLVRFQGNTKHAAYRKFHAGRDDDSSSRVRLALIDGPTKSVDIVAREAERSVGLKLISKTSV